ncbi:MAG: tripartite tricarboxylate transporter permease [Bacillota bacterium]
MVGTIAQGFSFLVDPAVWGALAAGVFIGAIAGALPGITTTTAMAMLAPVTFYLPVRLGIPFLLGLYKGGVWGGAITAILLNLPGTNASIATTFDGYPLAKKGYARKALDMSLYASVTGELISSSILLLIMGPLSAIALKFGPPELFALIVFAIALIGISGDDPLKALVSALIGLVLATIGIDPLGGALRYTLGIVELRSGISFIPAMIGMLCLPELLSIFSQRVLRRSVSAEGRTLLEVGREGLTLGEYLRCVPTMVRSALLGLVIGIIPALSQVIAALLAYGLEKRLSPKPEKFGQGALEGIAAPEAANNAVNSGAMVPMLTFGIPGDLVTAVLIGAFMANNLKPGPTLIRDNPRIMYGLLLLMVLGNFVMLVVGKICMGIFISAIKIPAEYLVPAISVLVVLGAFSANNSLFDVWTMIACGFLGCFLKRYGFPIPPLLITFLLGYRLEMYLSQTLLLGNGSLSILRARPIALWLLLTTLIVWGWAVVPRGRFRVGQRTAS